MRSKNSRWRSATFPLKQVLCPQCFDHPLFRCLSVRLIQTARRAMTTSYRKQLLVAKAWLMPVRSPFTLWSSHKTRYCYIENFGLEGANFQPSHSLQIIHSLSLYWGTRELNFTLLLQRHFQHHVPTSSEWWVTLHISST